MGGAVWGPITSLNPFSPSNSQLDDYLQSMVYLPLFLFSPVTGSLYPALGGELHRDLSHSARLPGLRAMMR